MKTPHEFTLSNGLRVVYVEDPGKTSFTAAITAKGGLFYEALESPRGLAHFTEHMCFDGTKNFPDKENLVASIDDVGGDWNGYTSNQSVTYYAHTLGEDAERALRFVSEVFCNPLFEEKFIKHEKSIIAEEISGGQTDPWQKVFKEINIRSSHDSRLQSDVIGTHESVGTIQLDDVTLFHEGCYCGSNAVLGIAGPRKFDEIKLYVENMFSDLTNGSLLPDPDFKLLDPSEVITIGWPTAEHAHLAIGYDGYGVFEEKSTALAIGMGIFGGGSSSRLFRILREREGLCYMIGAQSSSYQTFGSSGVMSGLSVSNLARFVEAYNIQRKEFILSGPTEQELEREKKSALTSLLFKADSTFGLATHYAASKLFRPDCYQLEDIAEKIKKVTLEEVKEATSHILSHPPIISVASKENIDKKVFDELMS